MRIHIITVGQPKLAYAKAGWEEYYKRLQHYHAVRVTHVPDKHAYDATYFKLAAGNAYTVVLVIDGKQYTSPELANFLETRALDSREVCFIIGGPEGLPTETIAAANGNMGLSRLTFPHDLAMVILLETLYRSSTIQAGLPYHK